MAKPSYKAMYREARSVVERQAAELKGLRIFERRVKQIAVPIGRDVVHRLSRARKSTVGCGKHRLRSLEYLGFQAYLDAQFRYERSDSLDPWWTRTNLLFCGAPVMEVTPAPKTARPAGRVFRSGSAL